MAQNAAIAVEESAARSGERRRAPAVLRSLIAREAGPGQSGIGTTLSGNALAMRATLDPALPAALHLWLINRGVLIAPFHNMMLVSPMTEDAQIDRLVEAVDGFAGALAELAA